MVSTTVRVVNKDGKDVKHDGTEIGEIVVKGPGVLGNQEEWHNTGDMGTINEDGQVTIVERKKDIVLNGKDSISSIEVERVLKDHQAVQEVAIIVTPHKLDGEILHAIVVPHENHLVTKEELLWYAHKKLDSIACPKEITFVNELPKTPSGKIQKLQLKELL